MLWLYLSLSLKREGQQKYILPLAMKKKDFLGWINAKIGIYSSEYKYLFQMKATL